MTFDIVGKGGYSVVISPVVTNIHFLQWIIYYNDRDVTDVSKVFKHSDMSNGEDDFRFELDILKKVMKIEGYTTFTVPIKGASKFYCKELKHNRYILDNLRASYSILDNDIFYQIIFGNGGIPVNQIKREIRSYKIHIKELIEMLKRFYNGIQLLHINNIIHRDIKPTNILLDCKQNKLNIIDFGLACDVKDVYDNSKSDFLLSNIYMFHPPEFYVHHLLTSKYNSEHNFQQNLDSAFENIMHSSDMLSIYYENHYYKWNKCGSYDIETYADGFRSIYISIKEQGFQNIEEIFTYNIASKCDIYSSSYILQYLMRHIIFDCNEDCEKYIALCHMAGNFNPFLRSNIFQILKHLDTF